MAFAGNLLALGCLALLAFSTVTLQAGSASPAPASASAENSSPAGSNGPTLHLDYRNSQSAGNALGEFMYFVPLISPEPVAVSQSTSNTQRARLISLTRHSNGNSFTVTCDFEFGGQGYHRDVFDHSETIRRSESRLKAGGSLGEQLSSITVEGPGKGSIEVEGTMNGQVATISEVRLRFNGKGSHSPVIINLQDIKFQDGAFRACNELVARVNTLTFRKKPGPAKMEITVASVKSKDAGNGRWQNFIGSLKATAANLMIKPVTIEPVGHQAMLNFGLALASESPSFTFPAAANLKASM